MSNSKIQLLMLLLNALLVCEACATDLRAYQHGIDIVPWGDTSYRLFWSSAPGNPPVGEQHRLLQPGVDCDYFIHDIYSAVIYDGSLQIQPTLIISMPEAQEPVSAARDKGGNTLLTFEDGSDSDITNWCDGHVEQRYQLFDANMNARTELKTVSIAGGHSGHAASLEHSFVIAYSEGWIDGMGVDEAGTGDDIHIDVVDNQGILQHHRAIAVDHGATRDDWPLVAASKDSVIVLWQRYVEDSDYAQLMYSVYRPSDDQMVTSSVLLQSELLYYHYDVQYLADVQRFVVVGNRMADGVVPIHGHEIPVRSPQLFVYLLDTAGHIVNHLTDNLVCGQCESYHYYTMVREAQPAILEHDTMDQIIYPVKPRGLIALRVTATDIYLGDYYSHVALWFPLGTDGAFIDPFMVYFATLTPTGLKSMHVSLLSH